MVETRQHTSSQNINLGTRQKLINIFLLCAIIALGVIAYTLNNTFLTGTYGLLIFIVIIRWLKSQYQNYEQTIPEQKIYWQLLRRLRIGKVIFNYQRFRLQEKIYQSSLNFRNTIALLASSINKVISGTIVALIVLEICRFFQTTPTNNFVDSIIRNVPESNGESYDGIFIAVLTFITIFIPLYLTNLTSAIENKYAELPSIIRGLIFQERVENTAIQFLFFLTAYNLVALFYSAVWSFRPTIVVGIAATLGSLSVPMLIVHFTRQSSIFLDPTGLSRRLFHELNNVAAKATIKGEGWDEQVFQQSYYERASLILESLQALSEIAIRENHRRDSLIKLVTETVAGFLPVYVSDAKGLIPKNSRWFELTIKFKDWYLADAVESHAVMLASATQTSLPPNTEPDHAWIEKRLLAIAEQTIGQFVQDRDFYSTFQLVAAVRFAFASLGKSWETDIIEKSLMTISQAICDNVVDGSDKTASYSEREILTRMQTIIDLTALPIEALLDFFKTAQNIDNEILASKLKTIDWGKKSSLYELGLPSVALEGLEYLRPRLQFELEAESRIISPDWYLLQVILRSVANEMRKQIEYLLKLGENFYGPNAERIHKKGSAALAVLSIRAGLEFYRKYRGQLVKTKTQIQGISEAQPNKEISWPEWDKILEEIQTLEDALVLQIAQYIPDLIVDPITLRDDVPDLLGEALNIVGQSCFAALYNCDSDKVSILFQNYFVGIRKKHEVMQTKVKDLQDSWAAVVYQAEPFSELLELSGYAYIFSEYHQNKDLWNPIIEAWEDYMNVEAQKLYLYFAIYLISYVRREPAITARSLIRNQWRIALGTLINTLPFGKLSEPEDGGPRSITSRRIRKHPSLLIRRLAGSDNLDSFFIGGDPASVFVDLYLKHCIKDLDKVKYYYFDDIGNDLQRQSEVEAKYKFDIDAPDVPEAE